MSGGGAGGTRVTVLADARALAERAAVEVVAALEEALARRSRATWVLAGGSTPRRLYELLARRPEAVDWRRVELFWGDERCLPPSSRESNYGLVHETLLSRLPIAAERVHRIRGELPPAEAAAEYAAEVARELARGPFDLTLLGLGADGHTASLFPGAAQPLNELVAEVRAPSGPRWRVTLTLPALAATRRLLYLVAGGDKAAAVARALDRNRSGEPVADRLRPRSGSPLWLLDRAAAAALSEGANGPVVA